MWYFDGNFLNSRFVLSFELYINRQKTEESTLFSSCRCLENGASTYFRPWIYMHKFVDFSLHRFKHMNGR